MTPLYHEGITPTSSILDCDFLVIGAGVAGLRAAIALAAAGRVLVVAKDKLKESSSEYAQGGIAVALSDDDEVALHESDTLAAGDGLCDQPAVHVLVEEGPKAIEELLDWGAAFDREGNELLFAREAAHSRSRVLHAHGDSTGQEIARTLYQQATTLPNIKFRTFSAITDLLLHDGEVTGAVALDTNTGSLVNIYSRAVLLATGGMGRLFRDTTNPDVATGDGVAMGYRAGALVSDIEFIQFHPTALYSPGAPRFLLSEALRGDGAILRNLQGEAFMERYSPAKELAPRDVVSRSIVAEMRRTGTPHVLLDLTHLDADYIRRRFPRIHQTCLKYGVDISTLPAPVVPAAHYAMGGLRTDLEGRTTVRRLYAAGEVACTGVHGANRLASNSLLEGVVYGARAGRVMCEENGSIRQVGQVQGPSLFPMIGEDELRKLNWDHIGITRSGDSLSQALDRLAAVKLEPMHKPLRQHHELRNIHLLGQLMARCALARKESRGGHYRTDYPERSEAYRKHSAIRPGSEVSFV